jgi:hypothetical protein
MPLSTTTLIAGSLSANLPEGAVSNSNPSVVNITASAAILNKTDHNGRFITLNRAAGQLITLPAAIGDGSLYRFIIGASITSNSTIIRVANTFDAFQGLQLSLSDNAAAVLGYAAVAGTDDTVTFDGTTRGGLAGDTVEIRDVAVNRFQVNVFNRATGTEATCFSATV